MPDLAGLPGGRRISRGLQDLADANTTVNGLLVAVASRRLRELGLEIPPPQDLPEDPELKLYDLLGPLSDDPYYAYRSLLNELDSFISCLEMSD